ncbi:MAG: hypothetical protein ACYSWU_12470 [Planctomycetota bacterium]
MHVLSRSNRFRLQHPGPEFTRLPTDRGPCLVYGRLQPSELFELIAKLAENIERVCDFRYPLRHGAEEDAVQEIVAPDHLGVVRHLDVVAHPLDHARRGCLGARDGFPDDVAVLFASRHADGLARTRHVAHSFPGESASSAGNTRGLPRRNAKFVVNCVPI